MKYAILAYVPPARLNSEAFVRNLKHYKTKYPVVWYSEEPGPYIVPIPDPTSIKLSKNRVAIHNRIYLHGLEIAQKMKLKRFIYLESDCRVGCDHWDEAMFNEAEPYKDMFASGTPGVYNSKAMPHAQEISVQHYCARYTSATGFKMPVFEAKTPRPTGCLFIMGAGAVYNTAIMADLFMGFERDANQKAIQVPAFDLFIGMRCAKLFGPNAVNKLPFLTRSFSSYGSKINSESDRIDMLRTGRSCLVHQVKGNEDCIWNTYVTEQKETSTLGQPSSETHASVG